MVEGPGLTQVQSFRKQEERRALEDPSGRNSTLRTPAIGLLAIYGSRGNAPTLKNYALASDLEAKSLECDDYA